MLYHYEVSAKKSIRQLRTIVIPQGLRDAVISAVHVAPMTGHLDKKKTLWRIVTRFWWPNLARDVTKAVESCAHCKVANFTSHEAQQRLKAVMAEAPFDILALDIWRPGDVPAAVAAGKNPVATLSVNWSGWYHFVCWCSGTS